MNAKVAMNNWLRIDEKIWETDKFAELEHWFLNA
jgi:hypothetical protein